MIELFGFFFILPLITKIKKESDHFVLIYRDGLKEFTQKEVLEVLYAFPSREKLKAMANLGKGKMYSNVLSGILTLQIVIAHTIR